MIDDILTVNKCGVPALEMNAILNSKVESKKLRMNKGKCYRIHIVKNSCKSKLKVHEFEMERATSAVYLGDVINESGNINETVRLREVKAIGIISQITSILKTVLWVCFTPKWL